MLHCNHPTVVTSDDELINTIFRLHLELHFVLRQIKVKRNKTKHTHTKHKTLTLTLLFFLNLLPHLVSPRPGLYVSSSTQSRTS